VNSSKLPSIAVTLLQFNSIRFIYVLTAAAAAAAVVVVVISDADIPSGRRRTASH